MPVPADLRRAKGWAGQLVERALGAAGGSRPLPDFEALGVELKTVPLDARGEPAESTFVASLELGAFDRRWETSAVRHKLRRVAFVPVGGGRAIPPGDRRLHAGFVWSPSESDDAALRADYEEIVELIDEGFGGQVTGHRGRCLQLRPKSRDASALRWSLDEEGAPARVAPRAFYLRRAFTGAVLRGARSAEG